MKLNDNHKYIEHNYINKYDDIVFGNVHFSDSM